MRYLKEMIVFLSNAAFLFDSFQKTWYHSKKEICVKNGGTALKSNVNRESVLQKNQSYATEITDLTVEGNGVCHIQGMTVFVPHTAPGDQVRVKIVKVCKQYAFGIIEEMETPASCRIESDCPYPACGGCTFRHISYAAELQWKEKLVQDAFHRIGKLHPEFLPIVGGKQRSHYRNKAQYPVAVEADGKPVCGFYAKRSHRVIPVRDCQLQPVLFQQVLDVICNMQRKNPFLFIKRKPERASCGIFICGRVGIPGN